MDRGNGDCCTRKPNQLNIDIVNSHQKGSVQYRVKRRGSLYDMLVIKTIIVAYKGVVHLGQMILKWRLCLHALTLVWCSSSSIVMATLSPLMIG